MRSLFPDFVLAYPWRGDRHNSAHMSNHESRNTMRLLGAEIDILGMAKGESKRVSFTHCSTN